MQYATVNQVSELCFTSHKPYADPFNQVDLSVVFTAADGSQQTVPAFWAGENHWKARFTPAAVGEYAWQSVCSDAANTDLHMQSGTLTASAYIGSNPLYTHGGLQVMPDGRHLQHVDGTPFLWLADTWWMAFTRRMRFPQDFQRLIHDRVEKGFNVVQIVAGLYPDMNWYDERGKNEAGFPWDQSFQSINPAYFDMVDLRVAAMIDAGLTPCIVGEWGYFMDFAGMEVLKKHWRYLIARYAAYPVVWCAAGEALMEYYLADKHADPETRRAQRQGEWSELIRHMRSLDSFRRPITIHPTQYGRDQVSDMGLIDFEMLQTGHGGYPTLGPTVDMLAHSLEREPRMPVLVSEVNYEGIGESSREEIQRFHFWSCLLSGAMGHTYGANGLWQVNTREKPYGPSPHGTAWGNIPWDDAAQLPGSRQIGLGKKLLESYPWWQMETRPDWVNLAAGEKERMACYAAGIPGKLRLFYYPVNISWAAWQGKLKIQHLEPETTYTCRYFDPKTGDVYPLGEFRGEEYTVPKPPIFQDWVLILEA